MSLILTRSPYFVSRGNLDTDASLTIDIGDFDDNVGGIDIEKTYHLVFRNSYLLDISPLLNDFIGDYYIVSNGNYVSLNTLRMRFVRMTLSGSISGVAQPDNISYSLFSNGYLYSTDEYNKDYSSYLEENCYYAGSTDIVYKLDDANLQLSFISANKSLIPTFPASENLTVQYKRNGNVVNTSTKSIQYDYSGNLSFKVNSSENISYKNRVELDGGVLEESKCIEKFADSYRLEDYDELSLILDNGNVKSIKVKTIEECKNKPYRVTFLNRFGVEEDLWFFKRSDTSISVNKENFRDNSIGRYNSGNGVKTISHFNVNGKERIVLNSGFIEEEMNEAFRQLLLSEEVTLHDYKENKTYNVNLGTSELQYKQHINDKLINYTIEFEFAHEVINNVG